MPCAWPWEECGQGPGKAPPPTAHSLWDDFPEETSLQAELPGTANFSASPQLSENDIKF